MKHRLRTLRVALPSLACAFGLLLIAGCQSSGQNDLVARELRMQEDKIYAMEDYLSQYQQLLCQYRTENAALRRQIRKSGSDESLPAPSKEAQPAAPDSPSFRSPSRTSPPEEPSPPPVEVEIDVPALEETTQPLPDESTENMDAPLERDSAVLAAAYEEAVPAAEEPAEAASTAATAAIDQPAAVEATHTMSKLLHESTGPPKFVKLRGKVVANETGGGPRLEVDVEPMTVNFEPTRFTGDLSLMLLDVSNGRDRPASLARWDFSADDAQTALDEMPNHQTMRFQLELPLDVPIDGQTELWVRLMPGNCDKVLGHVQVNLRKPGPFSSKVVRIEPHQERNRIWLNSISAEIADRNNSVPTPAFDQGDYEGWTIARPNQPGQSSAAGGNGSAATWRAATQPLPIVVAQATPAEESSSVIEQASFVEPKPPSPAQAAPRVHTLPHWTPDRTAVSTRSGKTAGVVSQAAKPLARPVWSPLR